jgi:hypothetical protein
VKLSEQDESMFLQLGKSADWLRSFTGSRWMGLETQGGRISHRSKYWPATFRMSGLVILTQPGLFVSGASVDIDEEEWFFLEVEPTDCVGPKTVLAGARPPFVTVQRLPDLISLVPSVFLDEHRQVDVGVANDGYGQPTNASRVMWIAARSGSELLFVFADAEVPLDVFVTASEQTASVARTVLTTRATALGFTCRRFVLDGIRDAGFRP